MMKKITPTLVLRVFLGFVMIWFGTSEIMSPEKWTSYVPGFVANTSPIAVTTLVLIHGIVLVILGVALIFNFYRRITATLIALMLLNIIFDFLIADKGLSAISVRDIGLLGSAIALMLP